MFAWLTERRRKRVLAEPFPPGWDAIIERNVPLARRLDPRRQGRLRELVQIFIAEKHWEGCGGLELTEEMQVTIAAHACLLVIDRDLALYKDVDSILIYPGAVYSPPRPPAFFELRRTPVGHARALDGEAMLHGPVVLAWDAVLAGADEIAWRNVVIHELAHKLDMADGSVDGTPPLESRAEVAAWSAACDAAYRDLSARVAAGIPSVIDAYGATNEAEFFAVSTETFFLRPLELRFEYPDLYRVLAGFYRHEPMQTST